MATKQEIQVKVVENPYSQVVEGQFANLEIVGKVGKIVGYLGEGLWQVEIPGYEGLQLAFTKQEIQEI